MKKIRFTGEESDERFAEVWAILNGEERSFSQFDEAGKLLGEMKDKDAEWYYMHAAVDYQRWYYSDCRKHLKKAIKLDPEKEKYKTALQELEEMAKLAKDAGKPFYFSKWDAFVDVCGEFCVQCSCEICSGF